MSNPISDLSQGFSKATDSSINFSSILIMLGVIAGVYGIYKLYNLYIENAPAKYGKSFSSGSTKSSQPVIRRGPEFNSAQRKIIADIISEFKKKEFMADSVPFAVFEKFAEYFYINLKRLKISKSEVNRMLIASYPILPNSKIEIETVVNGKLYFFEKKVLSVSADRVAIEPIDPNLLVLPKGAAALINFSKNREFISGESNLVRIAGDKMIFSYPKNLNVFNERRYARIPVQYVEGKIFSQQMLEPQQISVRDISLEGIRIKTAEILKKKIVYKLSFSEIIGGMDYSFSNIESIVSKSFVSDKGYYEYGMSFLYLDIDAKQRLSNYLRVLADMIKVRS
jgi:hypothetical protein